MTETDQLIICGSHMIRAKNINPTIYIKRQDFLSGNNIVRIFLTLILKNKAVSVYECYHDVKNDYNIINTLE